MESTELAMAWLLLPLISSQRLTQGWLPISPRVVASVTAELEARSHITVDDSTDVQHSSCASLDDSFSVSSVCGKGNAERVSRMVRRASDATSYAQQHKGQQHE